MFKTLNLRLSLLRSTNTSMIRFTRWPDTSFFSFYFTVTCHSYFTLL